MGLKEENIAKEAYIAWLESHEPMSFTENDNIAEILDEIYEYRLGQDKTQIASAIENYIGLSKINLSKLDNAYGNLDFLFGNKKIRLKAYDEIFNKIREIRNSIMQETYHFNLWKEGRGNFAVCAEKAIKVSKTLFTSIESEKNGFKQKCIYQEVFYDIDESLEDFRVKIYWTKKRDPIERIPVMGQMINFEKDDK